MDALIGAWLLVMLPGGMTVANVFMIWRFFYSKDARHRRANFVVDSSYIPERTLVQLKKDWLRLRTMKREGKLDPPVIFLNGTFENSPSSPQSLELAVRWEDASLQGHHVSDSAYEVVERDLDFEALHEDTVSWKPEIQHASPRVFLTPDAFPPTLDRIRASEPGSSTQVNNSKPIGHDQDALFGPGPECKQSVIEINEAGGNSRDQTPVSVLQIPSPGSSNNNANYSTSGEDFHRVTMTQIKRLSDFSALGISLLANSLVEIFGLSPKEFISGFEIEEADVYEIWIVVEVSKGDIKQRGSSHNA